LKSLIFRICGASGIIVKQKD